MLDHWTTEYAAIVWDPHKKENVRKLEMVPRLGVSLVSERYRNMSMLEKLNWHSFEQHGAVSDG